MATFNNGESLASVRTKINDAIDKIDGNATISNDISVGGNITVTGTVDGRDVAADGTKLDGIEASATADQTGAEIKALYEAEADTNAFTDAEQTKLSGIEASADVTDTANVTAAGALMDSELTSEASVKALDQGVATTDSPTFAGLTTTANVSFGDNDKAIFGGVTSELQIYSDGSNSYVTDEGTGNLILGGNSQVTIGTVGISTSGVFKTSAEVVLYHNNVAKFQTTSTGVDITGTLTSDGLNLGEDAITYDLGTSGSGTIGRTDRVYIQFNRADFDGSMNFYTTTNGSAGISERLRIADNGDITFFDSSGNASFVYDESAGSTFNENGDNKDFRVESDGNTHMLFVDASTSRVGIGQTSAPQGTLHIDKDIAEGANYGIIQNDGTVNTNTIAGWVIRDGSNITSGIRRRRDGSASPTEIGTFGDESVQFLQNNVSRIKFNNNDDSVVVNEGGVDSDFRVESNAQSHALFLDASTQYVGINTSSLTPVGSAGGGLIVGPGSSNGDVEIDVVGSGAWHRVNSTNTTNWGYGGLQYFNQGSFRWQIISQGGSEVKLSSSSDGSTIVENARFAPSGFTFNEGGADIDFRVESNANTHMLFVDAGNSSVSVNSAETFSDRALNVREITGVNEIQGYRWNVSPVSNSGAAGISGSGFLAAGAKVGDRVQISGTSNAINTITAVTDTLLTCASNWTQSFAGVTVSGWSTVEIGAGYDERRSIVIDGLGNTTINEDSNDIDFRVESDSNTHALFVDAGSNKVAIFDTTAPASTVEMVTGDGTPGDSGSFLSIKGASGNLTQKLQLGSNTTSNYSFIQSVRPGIANRPLRIQPNGGETVINEGSHGDADFRVESDNKANMLFVDAGSDFVCIGSNVSRPDSSAILDEAVSFLGGKSYQYSTTDFGVWASNSNGLKFYFRDNTDTTIGSISYDNGLTGVTYNTTSDRRLKDNIEPIADGTEKLMAMKPVTHTWKNNPEADAVHGFIAQEMMDVVPEAVSGDPDGEEMMSMDYGRITPVLVAALQDAHNKIAALEKRLAGMETK